MQPTLLYITNGINGSGGLERVLSIKTTKLVEEFGYKIHIIVLNEKKIASFYHFSSNIIFHSLTIKRNSFKYPFNYIKNIKKIIKKINPDVISVCDDGIKGILFPFFFGKRIPVIYERHASIEIFYKKGRQSFLQKFKYLLIKQIINAGAKKFDKFVVLTKSNLTEWNTSNMIVIPNPLSFNPQESSSLTNKKVISVGSHSYIKGFDRLLKIWEEVNKIYPDWKLEIYGKKNPSFNLKKMINKKKLEDSVFLFDPVKNIQEKYMDSSIYAMTSRSEGFGMVLIEAMSCGVPCIAFDCPQGPKDIISDGIDGFLINDNDMEAYLKKLLLLISNKNKRVTMGNNAKENAKRYATENIIKEWDFLFKSLLIK